MKIIRMRTLGVLGLAALTGVMLLHTSQKVQEAEEKLAALKTAYAQEKESIRLLKTEWAFLNNPQRLETLSSRYLDLVPPQPSAMVTMPDELPSRAGGDVDSGYVPMTQAHADVVQPELQQGVQPAVFSVPAPRAKPFLPSAAPVRAPFPQVKPPVVRKNIDDLLQTLSSGGGQ